MAIKKLYSVAGIEDISKIGLEILKALANWQISNGVPNLYNISKKIGYSISHTALGVRELRERGIIIKTKGNVYRINDAIKEDIVKELRNE